MKKVNYCNGECNSPNDDYCGMFLDGEECPACKSIKEAKERTKIISGFPAVGKSFIYQQSNLTVLDSDSSLFSWIEKGIRNPDFPNNYIEHIKSNIGRVEYIFVSSHEVVRRALEKNGINYTLVYPSVELKSEYIERYKGRGNDENFITFIEANWVNFITDIEKETFPILLKLDSGQFLKDVLEKKG